MRWTKMKAMKVAAVAIIAWAAGAVAAFGQSNPGLRQGQVPTAAQWNSYFSAKSDYLGFTPLNPSSLVGSGAVTVTPGAGVVTVGCATCFLKSGGTITQTSGTGPGIGITQTTTGSVVPATALNYINANDTADITGGGYYFNVLIGMGAGMKGNRVGIAGSVGLNAASGNIATFGEYTGVYGGATAAANDNGTPGTERGSFFGSNFVGAALNGATNLVGVTAGEDDIVMATGSSAKFVWIRVLAHGLAHAVRGSVVDTMLALTSQGTGTTQTSRYGIYVGPVSAGASQYPLGTDSTLLYAAPSIAPGPLSILNGIVLDATITGNAFVSTGFALSGAGAISAAPASGSHTLSATNTFPLTVKTTAASTANILALQNTTTNFSTLVGFYDITTAYWYVGKLSSDPGGTPTNSFTVYDAVLNKSIFNITRSVQQAFLQASLSITPVAGTGYGLITNQTMSGTATANVQFYGNFLNIVDTADWSGNTTAVGPGGGVFGFYVQYDVRGGKGGHAAGYFNMSSSTTATTGSNEDFVGVSGTSFTSINNGGGSGTERGAFFGGHFAAGTTAAAATFLSSVIGVEINTSLVASSSTKSKIGLQIVQSATDVVASTNAQLDVALRFANQASAVGWTNGIQFDNLTSAPVKTTGNLIQTIGAWTVASILDASSMNAATTFFLKGPQSNFTVSGAGAVAVKDNITFGTAAKTVVLKQGANGAVGTFTCVSASNVTISNTYIAANDTVIIFYESGTAGATPPAGNAKTNGTSFRVACASGDTAVYNYAILKNAA